MKHFNNDYTQDNYRYIGRVTEPRKDGVEILTGKCVYLDDFSLPGMLVGKTLRSPYPHARILNIQTEAAKRVNGVEAVLTWKDVSQDWKLGSPPMKPLLGEYVQYVGDLVALVAADTEKHADQALELIEVEYEELPAVFNGFDALKEGAPELYPDTCVGNVVPPGFPPFQKDGPFWHLIRGDVEEGFKECKYIAEDTVEFAKMPAPAAPETPMAIVRWEGGDDYTVWCDSQSGYILKILCSTVIPNCNLDVHTFHVGGSYGNKQSQAVQVISAAALSLNTGKPVKVCQSKHEQMCSFETRLGSQVHARIGMDEEGVVRAVKAEWAVDTGCISNATQGQIGVGIGETQLVMAKCQNWDLDTNLCVTNKQPAGIVRGYGGQELNSSLSLLMGRTMREGNFDPVDVFKKNYVSDGDYYIWRDGRKWQAHSVDYVHAIEELEEKFHWKDKWKGWGVPTWTSEDGKRVRGVGCGIIGNADVGEDNTEAYVRVVPDLVGDKSHIVLQCNVTESGMGQRNSLAKMVAEIMKVPLDKVQVTPSDTMINPTGFGLCGSRGTITYGHAVSSAAEDVRRKLFELARPYLDVATDSMYLTNYGVSTVARPGLFVSWKKLIPQDLTLAGYGQHLENFSTPSMYMIFLEVEVNKETGKVDILNCMGGSDCGQVIDPAILEMQAHGGIGSASLDTATFEEHIIDPEIHRTMTYDMIEYKWRTFNEFPEFETHFMESHFDTFQFKAIGVGEISGAAAASATMQAISNAIGVQVSTYPATPDVILKALEKI